MSAAPVANPALQPSPVGPMQFGRAWNLVINTIPDETGVAQQVTAFYNTPSLPGWQPEGLHITFEVFQGVSQALWNAEIVIYNLDAPTTNLVITQGMTVQLSAGYVNQPYGVIFEGTVFQPLWERENIVDFKLTLRCIVGFIADGNNFSTTPFAAGLTQRQLVARMAANAMNPVALTTNPAADTALSQNTLSKGGVIFGQVSKYLDQASKYNGSNSWYDAAAANIQKLISSDTAPTFTFGYGNGLLGTPQQTQLGVDCRVLLDPRITPAAQVVLNQTGLTIRQLQLDLGTTYPTVLDQSGTYAVAAVRHIGDSRGNTWETQITGLLYRGALLAAVQAY